MASRNSALIGDMISSRRLISLQRHSRSINTASRRQIQYQGMAVQQEDVKLDINSRYKMNSGYEIPVLGFGVYQTPAATTESIVLHALKTGYRHIDSARAYRNEQPCGEAIQSPTHKIPRQEIFFTSKVPPRKLGYESTEQSILSTLSQTALPYIDLYLIHAPYGGRSARLGAWDALLTYQKKGLIRSLGVSNYGVHHLAELESHIASLDSQHGKGAGGAISVGQWELHPWLPRDDIVTWCRARGVVVQAYCPLVRAQRADDPILGEIAGAHGKTWAQVLVRWSLQKGFVPLPKSENGGRIEENADVFGFELSEGEMGRLERSGGYEPCSWDPTVSQD